MNKIFLFLRSKKIIFLSTLMMPLASFAGGETPISDGLSYVTNAMYGATGITLATLAVMLVGLLCLFHVFRWIIMGYTLAGICLIFGAGGVVSGIVALIHNI